jgi:ligand-binding SRPBCC domain-containing protein
MDIKSFVQIQTNDVVRKRLAKVMVRDCFRNTMLEDYHAGTFPSSKMGDYSDVKVISPFGEIAWIKLSRLSDEEMKTLMIDVVERCYKFLLELFLTGRGDDLINMLQERDILATWHDPGASEPSHASDG